MSAGFSLPISKELAQKLVPMLEPNTPGSENPFGSGYVLDAGISIAISLKRIADAFERAESKT